MSNTVANELPSTSTEINENSMPSLNIQHVQESTNRSNLNESEFMEISSDGVRNIILNEENKNTL
jgi:hypothetical protein